MGGFGSGRHGGGRCTDDLRPLDVRRINRAGLLMPGRSFTWQWTCNDVVTGTISMQVQFDRVMLNYRTQTNHINGGQWESMNYAVRLDWTPCGFGGRRAWWRCPVVGCGRRVAVLYGGRVFACRQCHQLAYRCQRESRDDRSARRAETIRRRLNWVPGILNGEGWKPKGMHWRTFERLKRVHDVYSGLTLAGLTTKLNGLRDRFGIVDDELERWGRR